MSSQENFDQHTFCDYRDHTPQRTRSQERPHQSLRRRRDGRELLRLSRSQLASHGVDIPSLWTNQSCSNNRHNNSSGSGSFWNSHHISRATNSSPLGCTRHENHIRKSSNGESPILAYKMRKRQRRFKISPGLDFTAATAGVAATPLPTNLEGSTPQPAVLPTPNVPMDDTTHGFETTTAATRAAPLPSDNSWWEQEEMCPSTEKIPAEGGPTAEEMLTAMLGWPVCPCCHMPHSGLSTPNAGTADGTATANTAAQLWPQDLPPTLYQIGNENTSTPFQPPHVEITPLSSSSATTHLTAETRELRTRVLSLEARVNILYIVLERIVNHLDRQPDAQPWS